MSVSSIKVTLAEGAQFPNFPNPCEEVRRRAIEMGIRQDICIQDSGIMGAADSLTTFDAIPTDETGRQIPSSELGKAIFDNNKVTFCTGLIRLIKFMLGSAHIGKVTWVKRLQSTLQLPHNFPADSQKEAVLRHELIHILHQDSLAYLKNDIRGRCYKVFSTIAKGFNLASVGFVFFGGYVSSMPAPIRLVVAFWLHGILFRMIEPALSRSLLERPAERRADTDSCQYLSLEEKTQRMEFWAKRKKEEVSITSPIIKVPLSIICYFLPDYSTHPSYDQRIQIFWDSFTEEQKTRLQDLKQRLSIH
jgi:hypothetical protein